MAVTLGTSFLYYRSHSLLSPPLGVNIRTHTEFVGASLAKNPCKTGDTLLSWGHFKVQPWFPQLSKKSSDDEDVVAAGTQSPRF